MLGFSVPILWAMKLPRSLASLSFAHSWPSGSRAGTSPARWKKYFGMRPNRDGGNLFLQCSLSGEQLRIAHWVLFDEFKLDCRFDDVVENTHAFPAFAVAAKFVGV